MKYSSDETPTWSTSRWEPPAPESYVLLNGVDRPDAQPFKLAITELVARGALKLTQIEESGIFGRRKQVSVLTEGDRKLVTEHSLAPVQRIFGEAKLSTFSEGTVGVKVEDLAVAAQRHYKPISAYTTDEVLPALMDRGYFTRESRKILGIFPSSRYVLTPSGEAARADLQQRMDAGHADFHGWVRNDPSHAMLYMGMAGSSMLLMPMLFNDVEDLRRRQGDTMVMSSFGGGGSDEDEITGESAGAAPEIGGLSAGGLDFSAMDLGGLDLSAFDGLDTALGAIDAGIDSGSGGGWGGGDGGGGDGGGGGGGD
jgi:hypothetical protein